MTDGDDDFIEEADSRDSLDDYLEEWRDSDGDGGGDEQDRVLSDIPEHPDAEGQEKVTVRLTPRMLHELYIELNDVLSDVRQGGDTAECDLCGESVPLMKAVPNKREEPVHRHCYVNAYGGPEWLEDC